MELLKNNILFSFVYDGSPSGECMIESTVTVKDGVLTRICTFDKGLTVTTTAKKIERHGAYEWVHVFENTSNEPTGQITALFDADITRPFAHEEPRKFEAYFPDPAHATKIYSPSGSEWRYDEFSCDVDMIVENRRIHHIYPNEEKYYTASNGRSSEMRAPFFNIHKDGNGFIFAIGWSGGWHCKIRRGTDDIGIQTGIEHTDFYLKPGECYRTSSFVFLPYSGSVVEAQNKWRRLVKEEYSPLGKPGRDKYAPLCANVWGGMKSELVLERIESIRKQKLPYEYLWMDAGWYGDETMPTPDEFEGDWASRNGDWSVSRHVHPGGLADISEAVHKAGMKFLLWFEPERARCTSKAVKEHPEYFIDIGEKGYGNLLLKLGDSDAWNYCHDLLAEKIQTLSIDCLRIDFNFAPMPYWLAEDEKGRVGMTEIQYINGFYRLWDALLEEFPHLLIDDCASGGRRIDIETLRRSVPLWRSDLQCPANPDSHATQAHTISFNTWMPYSGTGTGRLYDLYRIRSAYGASLATNFTFSARESFGDDPEKTELLRRAFDEYLKARPYFSEDFYPLTEISDKTDVWCAFQFDRPSGKDGLMQIFRRENAPYVTACFRLGGILPTADYTFTDADDGSSFTVSGSELTENGLTLTLPTPRTAKLYFYTHS